MAFKAGAVVGEALLETAKWTSGVKIVQSTSKKLGGVLTSLAKIGFGALAAGMTAAVYQANEYQKEFKNVSTLTNQNTKDLQDMSIGLLSIQSELGSTRELTRSMYDAISAGAKPGKDALEVVTSSAKFAKAAMADNAASVKLLSATVNAYGSEVITSEKAADIFFTTIKDGVITGEELASTIGQSIPLYASMNIPVEQLAAGMAAMTKQGVSAAESTTQLNAIVNAFLKPSEALTEILKEQGYQSGQAFIKANGLSGALDLLKGATEGGKYEISDLTGNIRAMKGVLALSGEGAKIFDKTLKDMADSSGAVNTAFGKQEKTFATLKNEMAKSTIILGNVGKSFVDDIAGGAQTALESINDFILSGRALKTISNIASKVGGAFKVVKTFAMEVYNLFADNLNKAINDIVSEFDDLFGSSIKQGEVFDALSSAVDLLGAGLNIAVKVIKLMVINFANLINIAINASKTLGTVWEVITGKKSWADVKKSFSGVIEATKKFGTDYINNTSDIISEAMTQWDKLTQNSKDDSSKFAKAWEEGSKNAKRVIEENYTAAISGIQKQNENFLENQEETNESFIENEENKNASLIEIEGETTDQRNLLQEKEAEAKEKAAIRAEQAEQRKRIAINKTMETVQQSMSTWQSFSDLFSILAETRIQELENEYKSGIIAEEDYNAKRKSILLKQLKAETIMKSTEIAINSAVGIIRAFGEQDYYSAIIIGASITAQAVAAQSILAAQYKKKAQAINSYAEGTNYHTGGIAMINEEGGEIVDLPTGTRVFPHDISEQMVNNNKSINITINNPSVRSDSDITKIANSVSEILGRQLRIA